jgi:AcrR family transcriptional regulator
VPVDTEARILEGALTAIGRLGVRKVGMQDVSDQARVSRGTVYRYFSTKEELLGALVRYERLRYERGLELAIRDHDAGAPRVTAMVEYAFRYFDEHPVIGHLFEAEPAFVLDYVRDQLPRLQTSLVASLAPDLGAAAFVRTGLMTVEQFAELLIRVLLSMFVVPADDAGGVRDALCAVVAQQYGEGR